METERRGDDCTR